MITSTLRFVSAPDAPHRLRVTYQAPSLGRWDLMRLNDVDGDRLIEYQHQDRAYKMPQDSSTSVVLDEAQTRAVRARMALRFLVFTDDPDGPSWDVRELGPGLGEVHRTVADDGALHYDHVDAHGQKGEKLVVRERFESSGRSWPHELELAYGPTEIWTELVEKVETQSWFAEAYFVPPDRVSDLSPK